LFPEFHFFMLGMKLSPRAMPARALPSGRPGAWTEARAFRSGVLLR
jgi:hypothetical protein